MNQYQLCKYLLKNLAHQEDRTYFTSCHKFKFLKLSLNTKLSTSSTKFILYSETWILFAWLSKSIHIIFLLHREIFLSKGKMAFGLPDPNLVLVKPALSWHLYYLVEDFVSFLLWDFHGNPHCLLFSSNTPTLVVGVNFSCFLVYCHPALDGVVFYTPLWSLEDECSLDLVLSPTPPPPWSDL